MDQRSQTKKYFEFVIRSNVYDEDDRKLLNNWRIKGLYNQKPGEKPKDMNNDTKCNQNEYNGIEKWNNFVKRTYTTKYDKEILDFINQFSVEKLNNKKGLDYWKKEWCKHGSWWFFSVMEYFAAIKNIWSKLYFYGFEAKSVDPEGMKKDRRGLNTDPSKSKSFVLKFYVVLYNNVNFYEEDKTNRIKIILLDDEIKDKKDEIDELQNIIRELEKKISIKDDEYTCLNAKYVKKSKDYDKKKKDLDACDKKWTQRYKEKRKELEKVKKLLLNRNNNLKF